MYDYLCLPSIFSGFFPLSLFLILKNKLEKDTFLIFPYLIFTFFASLYELIFTVILKVDSSVWFKIYTLIEFFVLIHYFHKLLKGKYTYFFSVFSLLFLICFGFIVYEGKIANFMDGDLYLQIIDFVFIISATILWMKYAFINLEEDSLLKYSHFYFITGLLFYFSGTLFLFMFGDVILENQENKDFLNKWTLNLLFNIFLKILLLTGIWKARVK
jgi:hypothetical protein